MHRARIFALLGWGAVALAACGDATNGASSSSDSPMDDGGAAPTDDAGPGGPNAPSFVGGPCDTSPDGVDLPEIGNVRAFVRNDSLELEFDSVDDARDYRVYHFPDPADVTVDGDGVATVRDALYRCAGARTASTATLEDGAQVQSGAIRTRVDSTVESFRRTTADATLGYVYTTPGAGRTPVYALGNSSERSENSCYFHRWSASRVKTYTASESERTTLLGERCRDDGILFYAPAADAPGTRSVSKSGALYFAEEAERAARSAPTAVFSVLATEAPGRDPSCASTTRTGAAIRTTSWSWARRTSRRSTARNQPLAHLHWSGLEGEAILVVEAVDASCPYQGHLTASSSAGREDGVDYPFSTVADVRAAPASGEVFVSGQGDPRTARRPPRGAASGVAEPAPAMDFSADFKPETFSAFQNTRSRRGTRARPRSTSASTPSPGTGTRSAPSSASSG